MYAKSGTALTLTVNTSGDARCVKVDGAFTDTQVSPTSRTSWTFTAPPAGATEGAQSVTVGVTDSYNTNNGNGNNCTGTAVTGSATYTVDNTGPTLSGVATPAPNTAGWNNTDVTVAWTATDTGSGIAAPQPFKTETLTASGILTATAPAQKDRLGNLGPAGSKTVRIDKVAPGITATQTSAGYGQPTTVTFTCTDTGATGVAPSGVVSCLASGSTTNSVTVGKNGTVTGTATDAAGNTKTLAVEVQNVDTTAPTLSGAPTTNPNGNGWYRDDVTVHWTATDPESGIPTAPADTTITGQGENLTSSTTVSNGVGLSTTATSSPAVKIDRTAPVTGISGVSNAWTNGAVNVVLSPTDNLSGVRSTTFTVDGGSPQRGTSFSLTDQGVHTITYSSTDAAGNVESTRTAEVKIDKTAPSIGHSFAPDTYTDGAWTNKNVTVTFTCTDEGGSGLASCTSPVTVSTEGGSQKVEGTATDNAGSSTKNTATVSIDKTPPTIAAHKSGVVNEAGWYNTPVTVSFTADDTLSGVASKTANKVLGEGENQSVTGTATDAAGNPASATASDIDIDLTDPELAGKFSTGWNRGDVTVDWSCTDKLSGPASQPKSTIVGGEGDNLTATADCADLAGNAVSTTVDGIKIDRTAPVTGAELDGDVSNGWYGGPVHVTLTPGTDLSGIAATFYTVDGGDPITYDGPFDYGTEGEHTFTFWSRDIAGNVEEAGAPRTVKIDTTKPVTTIINPLSQTSWFVVSGIPFAFSAIDGGSGIAGTYFKIDGGTAVKYGEPFTQDLNDGQHTVTYWSVDLAGNAEASRTVPVNVDTVPPTINGKASPAANGFGWNNTDVAVTFTCTDEGSGLQTGVAGCSGDTTLGNEGEGQFANGDAVDVAGNRSSASVTGIKIDKTLPALAGVPSRANGAGWYNDDVTVTWVGDDAGSGIDPATQPAPSTVEGRAATSVPVRSPSTTRPATRAWPRRSAV
ncbi:beta strand repeat-containing protein [Nocardioides mesophilus]|uniref:Ig-like domain-containing protein n=1 Tax=Nocardioides mesophilus TaxID=433659 RepID=A0A7G9RC16_9ACTN|nr:hypothetical protein [Nocardioides mesophilus]QNN53141.1 hypothetical protein H9L09_01170 [Nocardioides mesophilus]